MRQRIHVTRAMRQKTSLFFFAAITFLQPCFLSAQTPTGTILGQVTDQSNAVVPDAIVALRSAETNITRTTVTDGFGNYVLSLLNPGSYELSVEKAGFNRFVQSGINL